MTKPNLATQIKHYRFERNWTQTQMALAVGVSLKTIQRLEAGEMNQTEQTLYKLNRVIGIGKEQHAAA